MEKAPFRLICLRSLAAYVSYMPVYFEPDCTECYTYMFHFIQMALKIINERDHSEERCQSLKRTTETIS